MRPRKRGPANKKATLVDVAERANVSAITVSRVINQPDKVSEELRRRVQQAIDALGYIPNQSASSLASARSGVIGVSIPSLSNVVFNDVLSGIYDVAGASGYKVLLVDTHYSPLEEERMVRTLLSQSPEAMIITGGEQTDACQRMLRNARVPVVQMMELLAEPLDMNVGFSHRQAGYAMAEQITAAGYQRVGFIGARMDQRVQQRMAGFRRALEERDLFDSALVVTTPRPSSIALGGEMFRSLMASTQGALDAVFCCNDDLALGALFESQRMNIKVPDELGLCGFNDFEASTFVNPSLTSVYTPRYDMGVQATTMIVNVLKGEPQSEKVVDIGFEVRMRGSTRRPGQ